MTHRASLNSGCSWGTWLAHLNLASRKFCSGFQKYVVTNTRLVIGTVETLCCVAAEAGAGPAEHVPATLCAQMEVHEAVAGTAQARDPARRCLRHPHSQAVAEATAAPEAPSPPSPGAHGPHVPSAGQLEAALGPPLHAAA